MPLKVSQGGGCSPTLYIMLCLYSGNVPPDVPRDSEMNAWHVILHPPKITMYKKLKVSNVFTSSDAFSSKVLRNIEHKIAKIL